MLYFVCSNNCGSNRSLGNNKEDNIIGMDYIDDVWLFVEEKLKFSVPPYFRNVLKVCDYDNVYTIASIEENDVQYFEHEVRNGSVGIYFDGVEGINILDGSTKSIENFEFTRGHKKLLIYISNFLKNYLKENGPDFFMLNPRKSNKDVPLKGTKSQTLACNLKLLNKLQSSQNIDMNRDMKINQGILMCEVTMTLINTTPTMYALNMESVNEKISKELIKIEMKDTKSDNVLHKMTNEKFTVVLEAVILCPFCPTTITAFHKPTEANKFLWNLSSFVYHVELTHPNINLNQTEYVDGSTNNSQLKGKHPKKKSDKTVPDMASVARPISLKNDQCDEKLCEKLRPTPLTCYSATSGEEKVLQSYSEILSASFDRSLKYGPNKVIPTSSKNFNSENSKNHGRELTKEFNGFDTKDELIFPQLGNYVICALFVKETIKWPANANIKKNFVGRICRMKGKENVRNNEDECQEEIGIQFLTQSRYAKFIFNYPEKIETTRISNNRILKILDDPLRNRRGEYVFKDKSILDYSF